MQEIKKRKEMFRINYNKTTKKEIEEILKKEDIKYEKLNFYIDVYITDEEKIKYLDIYKNGLIYFQNVSAMLPAFFVEGIDILDMCSAPGGKTALIQTIYDDKQIFATEINYKRYKRMEYNFKIQDIKRVTIRNINAFDLDNYLKFDTVILDAPCSGSGTLKQNNYSKEHIKNFAKKQLRLLNKAKTLTKKNGVIIYSTCSINKEENEEVIKRFIKKENFKVEDIEEKYLEHTKSDLGITIKPTETQEGFYIVKLRNLNI